MRLPCSGNPERPHRVRESGEMFRPFSESGQPATEAFGRSRNAGIAPDSDFFRNRVRLRGATNRKAPTIAVPRECGGEPRGFNEQPDVSGRMEPEPTTDKPRRSDRFRGLPPGAAAQNPAFPSVVPAHGFRRMFPLCRSDSTIRGNAAGSALHPRRKKSSSPSIPPRSA